MMLAELVKQIERKAALFRDDGLILSPSEREAARNLGRQLGVTALMAEWSAFLMSHPRGTFERFASGRNEELADLTAVGNRYECVDCHRRVMSGLYFFDTRRCTDCERKALNAEVAV